MKYIIYIALLILSIYPIQSINAQSKNYDNLYIRDIAFNKAKNTVTVVGSFNDSIRLGDSTYKSKNKTTAILLNLNLKCEIISHHEFPSTDYSSVSVLSFGQQSTYSIIEAFNSIIDGGDTLRFKQLSYVLYKLNSKDGTTQVRHTINGGDLNLKHFSAGDTILRAIVGFSDSFRYGTLVLSPGIDGVVYLSLDTNLNLLSYHTIPINQSVGKLLNSKVIDGKVCSFYVREAGDGSKIDMYVNHEKFDSLFCDSIKVNEINLVDYKFTGGKFIIFAVHGGLKSGSIMISDSDKKITKTHSIESGYLNLSRNGNLKNYYVLKYENYLKIDNVDISIETGKNSLLLEIGLDSISILGSAVNLFGGTETDSATFSYYNFLPNENITSGNNLSIGQGPISPNNSSKINGFGFVQKRQTKKELIAVAPNVRIFPNPFSSAITISQAGITNIHIYNTTGKEIPFRVVQKKDELVVQITDSSSQIYFLAFELNNIKYTHKLIKQTE